MARNQRLADAVRSSGRPLEDRAADVGAHPKTLERWISSGRLPHATTRGKLASLLGVPAPMLWPEAAGAAYGISEVVGVYTTRNELSPSTVGSMLDAATAHVDAGHRRAGRAAHLCCRRGDGQLGHQQGQVSYVRRLLVGTEAPGLVWR
jgi:hypothetical protein